MKNAEIVRMNYDAQPNSTRDPERRTILMSVKKERRRKEAERRARDEARVASGRFNGIRGLAKVG